MASAKINNGWLLMGGGGFQNIRFCKSSLQELIADLKPLLTSNFVIDSASIMGIGCFIPV